MNALKRVYLPLYLDQVYHLSSKLVKLDDGWTVSVFTPDLFISARSPLFTCHHHQWTGSQLSGPGFRLVADMELSQHCSHLGIMLHIQPVEVARYIIT